jgi:hypothetical protein
VLFPLSSGPSGFGEWCVLGYHVSHVFHVPRPTFYVLLAGPSVASSHQFFIRKNRKVKNDNKNERRSIDDPVRSRYVPLRPSSLCFFVLLTFTTMTITTTTTRTTTSALSTTTTTTTTTTSDDHYGDHSEYRQRLVPFASALHLRYSFACTWAAVCQSAASLASARH